MQASAGLFARHGAHSVDARTVAQTHLLADRSVGCVTTLQQGLPRPLRDALVASATAPHRAS